MPSAKTWRCRRRGRASRSSPSRTAGSASTSKLLKKDDSGWVFNVASHPDFRGRGIVQDLLADLARRARAMGMVRLLAHVRADNRRARRAYEKAGFRSVGQDGMRGEQLRYEIGHSSLTWPRGVVRSSERSWSRSRTAAGGE